MFERAGRPLTVADPEASAVLREVLEDEGVQYRFGASAERAGAENGKIILTDRGDAIEGDALLVAVGRSRLSKG